MNKFEIIILVIFGVLAIGALVLFAAYRSNQTQVAEFNVTIWGVVPQSLVEQNIEILVDSGYIKRNSVRYEQKSINEFRNEFVNELASDRGPDLVILPHEEILSQKERIAKVPYTNFPLVGYRNNYVQSSEIFLEDDGILAFPYLIDPLVLYYNKDIQFKILSRTIPKTWDEVFDYTDEVIKRNGTNISQSLISLGGVDNIPNFKDTLSALIQQTGNDIVVKDEEGRFIPTLEGDANVAKAIDYYSEFSNLEKSAYTWNESLRTPFQLFTDERLYLYLGLASEYEGIAKANPTFNFDLEVLPQISGASRPSTFAHVYGVAVPKSTSNGVNSLSVAILLTSDAMARNNLQRSRIPHARKDIQPDPSSTLKPVYDSAFIAKNWIDINSLRTEAIFNEIISNVITNRLGTKEAIKKANSQIKDLFDD